MVFDSRGFHHKNSFDQLLSTCVTDGLCRHKLETSTVWSKGGRGEQYTLLINQDNEITKKQFALISDSTDYKE